MFTCVCGGWGGSCGTPAPPPPTPASHLACTWPSPAARASPTNWDEDMRVCKNILFIYLSPLADLSFRKDEDLLIFPSFCMMMVLGLLPLSTPLFWNIQFKCFSQFPLCLHQCSISGVSVMSSSHFVSIFVHKLEYLNLQQFSERCVVNDGSH